MSRYDDCATELSNIRARALTLTTEDAEAMKAAAGKGHHIRIFPDSARAYDVLIPKEVALLHSMSDSIPLNAPGKRFAGLMMMGVLAENRISAEAYENLTHPWCAVVGRD